MKAVIYCRKSTDRGDRQQLSIESQEEEALKIAKREGLEVVKIFRETKSAKDPGRESFNEMMVLFNNGKADCIITWKLNRLARNPVDEGALKWNVQTGIIKYIFTESDVFKTGDNVVMMGLHFGMSTQYILDLQKDIKRGIKQKVKNGGVCQKAPLGFLNNRLEKTVHIDKTKSQWVKEIFTLRSQHVSYKLISQILYKKGMVRNNGTAFPKNTLEAIIKNKFYIGMPKINGVYYKGNYETFISKNLFERAQNIGQGVYYKKSEYIYSLKGILKDSKGFLLSGYHKKGHIYYKSSFRGEKVNINEQVVFEKFGSILEQFTLDEGFKELNKEIILDILHSKQVSDGGTVNEIDFKIKTLSDKKANLLDLRLEGEINKTLYAQKSNSIINQIKALEEKKNNFKDNDLEKKIELLFELLENLSESYKQADDSLKTIILKNLVFELFVNSKKELSYAENSLLNCLKSLQKCTKMQMEVPSGFEPLGTVLQTAV